ncbi:MAG: mechanosensitive ion channel family protein [Acidimicrobiia bacterium]|nr:mechanosensitive ion channel family protein [Acidimicrobiia bacterium]MYB08995.1 mechanosensitive ion channel family protein [Acidimicrobiia bacterium]MYB72860.1 mechanosensitive ion channel family protein [Acidimicrobiia bacterium]MYG57896.1 mechanosensitive ion channel family protein [Acidimicrobiia bacterium]MYI00581.1 mechanosensitive ion channel family protein [Acidimicrobiia bacterium]
MALGVPAQTVTDACGPDPGFFCELVFDNTENERLAEIIGWVVERPLRIILILLVAWIIKKIVHKVIERAVARLVRQSETETEEQLESAGKLDFGARAAKAINRIQERQARSSQRIETIAAVMKSLATALILAVAALLCLSELNIDLAPLIAGAGIAGLAVGFGAQSLVRDFLAGMFILIEDQFGVGDVVDVGDTSGTIEKVSLRTTTLRDVSGVVWTVPNGEIRRTANHSQLWSRAILDIGVSYDTDIDQASDIMKGVADGLWRENDPDLTILEEPSVWGVQELGNDAVVIRLVVKTDPSEQWAVGRVLRARIKKAFDEAGIEIPFPQRTVWIRNEDDADGDPQPGSVDRRERAVGTGDDVAPAELPGDSGGHDGGNGGDE